MSQIVLPQGECVPFFGKTIVCRENLLLIIVLLISHFVISTVATLAAKLMSPGQPTALSILTLPELRVMLSPLNDKAKTILRKPHLGPRFKVSLEKTSNIPE